MDLSIAEVILAMHPEAQFVVVGGEYETIRWDSPDIAQPTLEEINAFRAAYVPPLTQEERIAQLEEQIAALMASK